ncbi:hypothetical protein [Pseudoalteromonas 'SMAR']|uniref:hypothetical protein n=1 Tax=Pseudoalteromonas 'SMAR' TaxID=3416908 RepID=UPI003AF243EA
MATTEHTKPAAAKVKEPVQKDFATRAQQYKNVLDELAVIPHLKSRLKEIAR